MNDNPKCPYCGKTMALHLRHGYFSYFCPSCYSEAPIRTTTEEAFAAAMKRDSGWVSVEDCPIPSESVLTCDTHGNIELCIGRYHLTDKQHGEFVIDDGITNGLKMGDDIIPYMDVLIWENRITHWMRLPNCGADMRKEVKDE